eukprot:CAMPEP_0170459546 /NCGR_PEP_ID=MMETSP0123-20130129/6195_1 /TAXON_ID=182087 /ORGANISM="Favella ehrenbergii, Strain Fehren 1" /LENGTH=59 /DNA_ID=CAMNT_0010724161 /DNA_START=486 /DNA_END=665 /DNA_ORIENTATION=-
MTRFYSQGGAATKNSEPGQQALKEGASQVGVSKLEDNEMVFDEDDDGDRLMEIAAGEGI